MPSKIMPPGQECTAELSNFIGAIQTGIASLEVVDVVYPLVDRAIRNRSGQTGNAFQGNYPRLLFFEDEKEVVIDLFPGARLEESYAFFERLGPVEYDDGTVTDPLALVFWIKDAEKTDPRTILNRDIKKVVERMSFFTGVSEIRIEDRIQNVWDQYSYTIQDFGQFQYPYHTFKILFTGQYYFSCCYD